MFFKKNINRKFNLFFLIIVSCLILILSIIVGNSDMITKNLLGIKKFGTRLFQTMESNRTSLFEPGRRVIASGKIPHVASFEEYKKIYKQSVSEPELFWGQKGRELLKWKKPFNSIISG